MIGGPLPINLSGVHCLTLRVLLPWAELPGIGLGLSEKTRGIFRFIWIFSISCHSIGLLLILFGSTIHFTGTAGADYRLWLQWFSCDINSDIGGGLQLLQFIWIWDWFLSFGPWMCSFLLGFLLLTVIFSHLQDFARFNFCYLEAQGQAQPGISQKAVVPSQNWENFIDGGFIDPSQTYYFQAPFKGRCIFEQDYIGNFSKNGIRRSISVGLSMWTAQQEIGMHCALCWGPWTKGTKHDVTPKKYSSASSGQWGNSWDEWDEWAQWHSWEQDWDDAESTGRPSSQSPRRYQNYQTDSPRSRSKGKGKSKKGKGKSKTEQAASPFGTGKGGVPSLPPWPVWNNPEVAASPFQAAQSSKNSTMQEMAIHLRQAYKDSEAPAEVQAFLDKADKESSRNNIRSLQAATKSLDHAQKALRDAVNAKKEHRL